MPKTYIKQKLELDIDEVNLLLTHLEPSGLNSKHPSIEVIRKLKGWHDGYKANRGPGYTRIPGRTLKIPKPTYLILNSNHQILCKQVYLQNAHELILARVCRGNHIIRAISREWIENLPTNTEYTFTERKLAEIRKWLEKYDGYVWSLQTTKV